MSSEDIDFIYKNLKHFGLDTFSEREWYIELIQEKFKLSKTEAEEYFNLLKNDSERLKNTAS